MKICTKCKKEKNEGEFLKRIQVKDGLHSMCKECSVEYRKNWKIINKEYSKRFIKTSPMENSPKKSGNNIYYNKSYHMNYFQKNKKRVNEYQKERKKIDILYRLKSIIRSRLSKIIKNQGWIKTSKFTEYIGCTQQEFKKHIELLWQPEMTWENYGEYGWHIDHIIPLASAKTEEELYKLCYYTNLQPLWAIDNLKKGAKIAA